MAGRDEGNKYLHTIYYNAIIYLYTLTAILYTKCYYYVLLVCVLLLGCMNRVRIVIGRAG